jgi:hypothetical protein
MPEPVDRVRSLAVAHAQACLLDLKQAAEAPRAGASIQSDVGWTVLLVAFPSPAGEGVPGLTPCDRDVQFRQRQPRLLELPVQQTLHQQVVDQLPQAARRRHR